MHSAHPQSFFLLQRGSVCLGCVALCSIGGLTSLKLRVVEDPFFHVFFFFKEFIFLYQGNDLGFVLRVA